MRIKKDAIIFYCLGVLCFLLFMLFWTTGKTGLAGWSFTLFFISFSIAFRNKAFLKGLSFTAIATVTIAMFYPGFFFKSGNLQLNQLIIPLIQLLMFGMGASMSIKDIAAVVKSPEGTLNGVLSQFIIMPLMGFSLVSITNFPAEIAAGIDLI